MESEKQKIFNDLKIMLSKYSEFFTIRNESNNGYELWSEKENITIGKQIRNEVFFASVVIMDDGVGLYYMPVYTAGEMHDFFPEDLVKLLKGSSVFIFKKKLSKKLYFQIEDVLKKGYELYKKRGWID